MKFPRFARGLRLPRRPPARLPGHGSAPLPRCLWETSSARLLESEPAETRCRRPATYSKPRQPVRIRIACEAVTVGPIGLMVDMSAPARHAANPNLEDFLRQHPSQQSARCDLPVPRAQLGSAGAKAAWFGPKSSPESFYILVPPDSAKTVF